MTFETDRWCGSVAFTNYTTERDFMLVVSRKVSEKITVATPCGAVIVTLVRIGGESVRIGIDAPREFRIMRNELIEEIGRAHV